MKNLRETLDITELLFNSGETSPEDLKKHELYSLASEEAIKIVGTASPMNLLRKTEELYKKYLQEVK